jgi:DNA invertase Pin-like site-specific DNA recombinase
MAIYGYARVSTDQQDTDRQVRDILEYAKKTGQEAPCIVTETASGAKDRPELMTLLDRLGKDDTILVCEFSRLTRRGIPELLEIARTITSKGAALVEIRSNTRYDNSAMGELLMSFTATMDRMERERIGERTKSALRARKAQGVKLGRPSTSRLDGQVKDINKYLIMGIDKTAISKLLGCSRGALINYLNKHPELYEGYVQHKQKGGK